MQQIEVTSDDIVLNISQDNENHVFVMGKDQLLSALQNDVRNSNGAVRTVQVESREARDNNVLDGLIKRRSEGLIGAIRDMQNAGLLQQPLSQDETFSQKEISFGDTDDVKEEACDDERCEICGEPLVDGFGLSSFDSIQEVAEFISNNDVRKEQIMALTRKGKGEGVGYHLMFIP